jgi:TolA-binding protein
VAYASRDFSSALVLVAEHARRYPNGRLAEEREALRIRSLAGSGRTADARRAIAAFAARFPRSVLLPRLQETPEAAD